MLVSSMPQIDFDMMHSSDFCWGEMGEILHCILEEPWPCFDVGSRTYLCFFFPPQEEKETHLVWCVEQRSACPDDIVAVDAPAEELEWGFWTCFLILQYYIPHS